MKNDKGAYFLLESLNPVIAEAFFSEYDNAEAARKAARTDEKQNPNNIRRLFKCLPGEATVEIMV